MMASMAQTFTPHPGGGMQHAPPGHPMGAPGMAHNPSQPGAQPGMPHQLVGHMGVSGPGGQMSQAGIMAGMPPGAGGPNAHAMQHLNPATQAQQLFQQQAHLNPMFANNPAMQQHQQMTQQRIQHMQAQQQQARQALMAQQAAGYGQGMQMGMPQMNQMSQQQQMQFLQLQARQRQMQGQPVPHAQLMAQQLQMQQQQQLAANHMAQGLNQNQAGLTQQQIQQQQQIQVAMVQAQQQHAQQQAHAQAQAQQSGQPQLSQGQPGQPQPQNPQQQAAQNNPGAAMPAQTQGPAPGQIAAQAGQQPPGQPHPLAQQQQQQQNHAAQQQAQLQHAQHQHNDMLRAKREGMKGHCLLKLMQFGEHLSGFPGSQNRDDLSYWNDFVQRFFSSRAIFRHALHIVENEPQSENKQYEITYPALARYFNTHFDSGVKTMQLILDKGTTDRPLPGDGHFIENQKASLVYWFEEGSHLVATGILRAQFDSEQKIELFEFLTQGHEEYISRRLVIQAAKPAHNWVKEWHKVNTSDSKQSPEMSKKGRSKMLKSPQTQPPDLDLPQSIVKQSMGITEAVHQFLEIVEILGQMNPLFGFYHSHPGMSPYAALEQYVAQINAAGPQMANPGMGGVGMVPNGPRTPGFNQFPVGVSPAAPVNSVLPGSPHVGGSPAPGAMGAPAMAMQHSQQGTSSSGPSVNTSPATSNKRRRASAVKNEDETGSAATPAAAGTPQVNGVTGKTKPPTPRLQKRVKGNPAA